jgi:hypothetical protein
MGAGNVKGVAAEKISRFGNWILGNCCWNLLENGFCELRVEWIWNLEFGIWKGRDEMNVSTEARLVHTV